MHTHPEILEAIGDVNDRVSGIDRRISVFQEDVAAELAWLRDRAENHVPHQQKRTKLLAAAGPVLVAAGYALKVLLGTFGVAVP